MPVETVFKPLFGHFFTMPRRQMNLCINPACWYKTSLRESPKCFWHMALYSFCSSSVHAFRLAGPRKDLGRHPKESG